MLCQSPYDLYAVESAAVGWLEERREELFEALPGRNGLMRGCIIGGDNGLLITPAGQFGLHLGLQVLQEFAEVLLVRRLGTHEVGLA